MFVNIEQYKKKTIGMALASVSAAVLNCVLNAIFIPMHGYIAAAYTTLAGYLFLLLMHMYLVKRLGYQKAVSYSFIGVTTLVMMSITIGVNFLYGASPVRYVALGTFCAVLLIAIYKNSVLVKRLVLTVFRRD